jgi:WD40 repeat protein
MPAGATARIGASPLQVGNSAFALTPDEKEIVAVSPEGIARRFDAATGKLLDRRQLTPRNDIDPKGQFSAKISANGKMAVIQERVKGMVRLTVCDIATGKILIRRKPDPDVRVGGNVLTGNYALSPDGKVLVVREDLDVRRILRAYDTSTGRGRDIGDLEINVSDIQFSADGKRVMVSQVAGTRGARKTYLACFDVPAGKQLWKLPDIDTPFAFSPDGRTVAAYTGGRANPNGYQIIDVNPTTDETTVSFQACRRAHPNFPFVFAPDNRTLVLSFNQEMVLWDIRTAQEIGRVSTSNDSGRGYGPMVGAFSADSKTVVTNYGRLQRWNLTTGDLVFESPPGKGLGGPIEDLAFTPDGKEVIASGWCNNSARWDAVSGKRLAIHNARFGHQYVQTPDGIRSVGADDYKTPNQVTVYDPTAGQELRTVEWTGPKDVGINGLRAFALARDGRTLVVASCDEPKKVRNTQMYVTVFDSVARRQLNRFTVPGEFYFTVNAFSPCGRWAAIGGKVYQTRTGAELFSPVGNPGERLTPGDDRVSGAAWFSADGRLLAGRIEGKAADGNTETETMGVWELATDKLLLRIPKAGNTARIDFGPDGRTIALADGWGVHVFDLFDGQRMADFAAPDLNFDSVARGASTQPVAYSPDGRTLATGHKDGTITLWAVPKPADTGTAINWPVLGSESPATARAMVDQAVRNPLVAMKHLAVEFLPPQVAPDPKVAALITDLDAALFATREEAAKKLGELGAKVEPAVRQALIGQPSMEARRRLEGILSAIPPTPIQIPAKGTTLCGLRAIEILERIGTTEARALLGKWADQVQDLQLAAEARSVLSRLTPLDISKRPDGK